MAHIRRLKMNRVSPVEIRKQYLDLLDKHLKREPDKHKAKKVFFGLFEKEYVNQKWTEWDKRTKHLRLMIVRYKFLSNKCKLSPCETGFCSDKCSHYFGGSVFMFFNNATIHKPHCKLHIRG